MRTLTRLTLAIGVATGVLFSPVAYAQEVPIVVGVHLEDVGSFWFKGDTWAGTRGQGRRLESFQIAFASPVPGLSLAYSAKVEDMTENEHGWRSSPLWAGSVGQSRNLEGFRIMLSGPAAANYNVWYKAHIEDFGDTGWFLNGEFCGPTAGPSRRIEAIKVFVARKR